jgi:hypothetical protein
LKARASTPPDGDANRPYTTAILPDVATTFARFLFTGVAPTAWVAAAQVAPEFDEVRTQSLSIVLFDEYEA